MCGGIGKDDTFRSSQAGPHAGDLPGGFFAGLRPTTVGDERNFRRGILFREHNFARENSWRFWTNSVSSANPKNSLSSLLHTNTRLGGTH